MKTPISILCLASSLFLFGCSNMHTVDNYSPMPAATEDANAATQQHFSAPIFSSPKLPVFAPEDNTNNTQHNEPAVAANDIWTRIRGGYLLGNPPQNAAIDRYRTQYVTHPHLTQEILLRGARYLHFIVEEAERRNMPLEVALLPMVESAFDPFVVSSGKAAGPWQFIPSTGKAFGLTQNTWQDDRRDIIASTKAALDYLQQIAKRFDGDWLLAIASYNAGPGNISRAIRRNKAQGLPTDYWSLSVSAENDAYLPKLFAVADIVRHPEKYNIDLPPVPNEPYFQIVRLPGQISLQQAADLAGISQEELKLLNAAFKRDFTSPNGPHRLLLPTEHATRFNERLQTATLDKPSHNTMASNGRAQYTVQSGDSLSLIAQRFNTTVVALQQANGINNHHILVGQLLTIR